MDPESPLHQTRLLVPGPETSHTRGPDRNQERAIRIVHSRVHAAWCVLEPIHGRGGQGEAPLVNS